MNLNTKIFNGGLAKCAINECNGELVPIIFDWDKSKNVALMNPSIFNDDGQLRMIVRGTNYVLNHSEMSKYPHWAGPLQYIHPENDIRLATENWLVDVDSITLDVTEVRYVNMLLNDPNPKWDFHGLEDARLIRWEGKLYLCGVRRDTTDNGQGRMELTQVNLLPTEAIEISRDRIPVFDENSYCEKNWMPVLDQPYTYVKWTNPTEVVKYNIATKTLQLVTSGSFTKCDVDIRGGSHVVPYKDYYIAFAHSVKLWKPYSGEKDSEYMNHIVIWDKDFNLIKISDPFKFINSMIEFCCGLCIDNNGKMIVSFAEADNSPFLLRFDPDWLINVVLEK